MSTSIISEARRHLFRALVQSTVGKRCVPQCTSDCQILSTSVGCHRQSHGERLAKPLEKIWVPLTNCSNMTTISFLFLVHHSSFSSKQIQKGAMVSVQLFSGQTALWLWMPKNANGPFLSLPFPSGFLREKLSSTQRSTGRIASHREPPHKWLENVLVKHGDLLTLKEISPKHRESHRSHTIGMTSKTLQAFAGHCN